MIKNKLLILLNYPDLFLKLIKKRIWKIVNFLTICVLALPRIHKIIARRVYNTFPQDIKNKVRENDFVRKVLSRFSSSITGPRKHIKDNLSIESFFEELNTRNCRYVILRWWENLPSVEDGEDIDIIISDEDRDKISDLITSKSSGQKLDIYTVKGTKGGAFKGIPYFKINLSEDMIANRELYKGIFYVPSTEYYFYSLAYHAILHKGKNSHVKGFNSNPTVEPEHDYSDVLTNLSKRAGLDINIDVKHLIGKLKEMQYYPSYDLLMKLSDINLSVREFLPLLKSDLRGGELALLIIREQAVLDGSIKKLEHIIEHDHRINILRTIQLDKSQKTLLLKDMRGANWSHGPYRQSGGSPSIAYIVYDYHPKPLSSSLQDKYPWFTNINLLKCKNEMRNTVFDTRNILHHYNCVHSTDNEQEASYFIRLILSNNELNKLESEIEEIRNNYKGKHKVIRVLSRGSRAKVELIMFKNRFAIKKTFKRMGDRFLEREIYASETLSKNNKYIVKLIGKGQNYLITEYHDDILAGMTDKERKEVLNKNKYQLIDAITKLYDSGYAHINLTPGNILMTKNEELKVIDFEFLYKYKNKPDQLRKSFDVVEVPPDFDSDLPMGYSRRLNRFKSKWAKYIGDFGTN